MEDRIGQGSAKRIALEKRRLANRYAYLGEHKVSADYYEMAGDWFRRAGCGDQVAMMVELAEAQRKQTRPTFPPNIAGLCD